MRGIGKFTFLVMASAFAFAACGGPATGAQAATDEVALAALVPADAVAYVRFASLDAVLAASRLTPAGKGLSRDALLSQFGGVVGDTSLVDGSRTIAMALVAPKGTRPLPLVFMPTTDGAKYASSLRSSGLTPAVEGSYVVMPLGGNYQKPTAPSALVAAKSAGLISLHVDVTKLSSNLGVLIQSGLDVFKASMAKAMADQPSGLDGDAMASLYVDFAKTLLVSGTRLDVTVDAEQGRWTATARYQAKAGSALDGWSAPAVDLAPFARHLRPTANASADVVALFDWPTLWPKLEPVAEAFADIYPEAARKPMRSLLQTTGKLYAGIGPVMLGSVDFANGMQGVVHMFPKDGAAMLAEWDALWQRPELADVGVQLTADPAHANSATRRAWRMQIDTERWLTGTANPANAKATAEAMQKLLGVEALAIAAEVRDEHLVMRLGNSTGTSTGDAAPTTTATAWPAQLQPALTALTGCNPLFVERIDMAHMLRDIAPLVAPAGGPALPVAADAQAEIVLGGGVAGSEWRLFVAVDVAGFEAMMRGMFPR